MTGRLLTGADHFEVTEIPAYDPVGNGEHLYVFIEKRGLNSADVARRLARYCNVPRRAVGFAGRKDKHAITRQWFSIQFGDENGLAELDADLPDDARLRVLRVARHRNKLKVGHLRGNRFRLGLTEVPADFPARLDDLAQHGVANRFGPQRFGLDGGNPDIARAWATGDLRRAAMLAIAGAVPPGEDLPDRGRGRQGARLLAWLRKHPGCYRQALEKVDPDYRNLIISAAQALICNAVMDARLADPGLASPRVGDIVLKPNGAGFVVGPAELDDCRERCTRLELAVSAPLPGHGVLQPEAAVAEEERAWSAPTAIDWAWFDRDAVFAARGDRRALRIALLESPTLEVTPAVTWLSFALPAGAYATTVLDDLEVVIPDRRLAVDPG